MAALRQHQCPSGLVIVGGDYAGLKGDARVEAMTDDLERAVQVIVESGQVDRWLNAMASNGLSRWSANNRLLAITQMAQRGESLDDLHMMGFRQWQGMDRRVNAGARAVWILAPRTRKDPVLDKDGNPKRDRDGRLIYEEKLLGFKSVAVFNISDTHGKPLPEAPIAAAEGEATPGTLEGLRDRVKAAGYSYEERELPGNNPTKGTGTLGFTDPASRRIVVDQRLSGAMKASVIAHELGHVHCGHVDQDYSEYLHHRGKMETEAEMTAYLVNRSRGMSQANAESFSPGYIASWSRSNPRAVRVAFDTSTKAFNKIMAGDWPSQQKQQEGTPS